MSLSSSSSPARGGGGGALTAPPTAPNSDRAKYNRVGLVNQGATCYLNSLLQVLYQIPYFRSSVYRCVGDDDSTSSKIPAALQELFFQLQECNHAPKTEALTKSFGWSDHEVLQQHDIHELLTLLRDELENRMKGTPSQGAINKLFEGTVENVIATLDGSYVSRRPEVFFDIQLEVAGYKSLMSSLCSLVKKDQLTGDNKYKVEEEGKPAVFKDAEKGMTYTRFPPVLCFHLKRFAMDMMSPNLDMRKINDRFEFGKTLDLRDLEQAPAKDASTKTAEEKEKEEGASASPPPPLKEGGDANDNAAAASPNHEDFSNDVPPIYDLHSIIVHKGSVDNGHYYCYVRDVLPKVKSAAPAAADVTAAANGASITSSSTASRHVDPMSSCAADFSTASESDLPNKRQANSSSPPPAAVGQEAKKKDDDDDDLDFENGQWYEFDDDLVRSVSEFDAINCNFGGRNNYGVVANNSAYMMTYIRRGYWKSVMRPIDTDVIPNRVKEEFRRVMAAEEARRKELAEEATRCYVNVVDDSHIFEHVRRMSFDLISTSSRGDAECEFVPGTFDARSAKSPKYHTLALQKSDLLSTLYEQLSDKLGYDKNAIRLRIWDYHYDQPKSSYRPSVSLPSFDDCQGTLEAALREAGAQEVIAADAAANTPNVRLNSLATQRALKVFLYVEQKRVVPLSPPPAINFLIAAEKAVAANDGGGEDAAAATASTNNKKKALDLLAADPVASHDGVYARNLLVTDPKMLVAEVLVSSQNDPNHQPVVNVRDRKSVSFAMRDTKPSMTIRFGRRRILDTIVLRFATYKQAVPANYMLYIDAFRSIKDYQEKNHCYRFTPMSQRLPIDQNNNFHYFVFTGDSTKYPNILTDWIEVITVVAAVNTPNVPITFMTMSGIYANEAAEGASILASQKKELAFLQQKQSNNAAEAAKINKSIQTVSLLIDQLESTRQPTLSPAPMLPSFKSIKGGEPHTLLLTIKGYTPNPVNGEHMRYLGPLLVDRREPLITYSDAILVMLGIPVDRLPMDERVSIAKSLRFVEEQRLTSLADLNPHMPIDVIGLIHGNTVIVERNAAVTSSLMRLPSVYDFWQQYKNRIFVSVRLFSDPFEPLFQCMMDLRWEYHQVCECIATRAAEYLQLAYTNGSVGGSPADGGGAEREGSPRDKLNASLASTALSKAGGGRDGRPIIDADKIVLYCPMDAYTMNIPASDPIKCTSKDGQSLKSILLANGGRYCANDLFFDIHSIPRLQMEQQVHMRAVLADPSGEIYTDELQIVLPPGTTPPDLVQAVFSAARSNEKVRQNNKLDRALRRLATRSEAFCLVGTRDNRIISFIDNMLLSNGDDDYCGPIEENEEEGEENVTSSDDEDDELDESDDAINDDNHNTNKSTSRSSSTAANTAECAKEKAARASAYIKPRHRRITMGRLATLYNANTQALDPSAFTKDIVYQLRPIELLNPRDTSLMRMYIGFCDCSHMKYTRQAPLFNTPIVITIRNTDTLNDVWAQLEGRKNGAELLKGARDQPQPDDGLTIKFVMYTDQALSFHDWHRTPVADYFTHTRNASGYRPMLCINKQRPKEVKKPRFGSGGAEPKLRLGSGQQATPTTTAAPAPSATK